VCLHCPAVRDRSVVEPALGPAPEAYGWPGGRVSLAITPYSAHPSVPTARWPIVLLVERYRGTIKVHQVALACYSDLVDPLVARALVNRA
jgi:hypothetical protein